MMLDTAEAGIALHSSDETVVVASLFHVDRERVHAPDADDLTTVIDALEAWNRRGHHASVHLSMTEDEARVVSASLPWLSVQEGGPYVVHRFQCGAAVAPRDLPLNLDAIEVAAELRLAVEPDVHIAMEQAWAMEMTDENVSQGAYVSGQVHALGMEARLGMKAQAGHVWPPRGSLADGGLPQDGGFLPLTAHVVSWTRVIAAGCPSEFAIRAPVLGGLTSMILGFDGGPCGVFLHVDGHPSAVDIGDKVRLVVRRVYAQDGTLRYGRKAIVARA